jgi:hypothetical protein
MEINQNIIICPFFAKDRLFIASPTLVVKVSANVLPNKLERSNTAKNTHTFSTISLWNSASCTHWLLIFSTQSWIIFERPSVLVALNLATCTDNMLS